MTNNVKFEIDLQGRNLT